MSNKIRHRGSLVLNVILVVTAGVLLWRESKPVPAPSLVEVASEVTTTPPSVTGNKLARYPETASASNQRRWLVDQLRAMGVPNKVLGRIVLADLDWAWNKRGGEVSLQSHGDPDTMAALKLENAMSLDAEMRAALGEEGFRLWDEENMLREANRGKIELTAFETEATYSGWKKLQQLELTMKQSRLKGEMDDADISEAYGKAVSEFEQQMTALLGAERYAKSQGLHDESSGGSLPGDLAKMNPSNSQFQELLTTQQQWNEQRSALDKQFQDNPSSAAYAEQLKALNAARDQEYRRVLGDTVFDRLQKEQHPSYSVMQKNAKLWGLDDDKIDSVYATMKYYEKSVQDYEAQARSLEAQGQSVDWAAVNKNLHQFADQTGLALQNYLGQDSFNKLQRNGVFQLTAPQNPPQLSARSRPSL